MGSSNTKYTYGIEYPYTNVNELKEYFDEAYKILDERLFTIPVKYIIELLKKHGWREHNIIKVLIYIKKYTQILEEDEERVHELEIWINNMIDISYFKTYNYNINEKNL